MGFFYTLTKIFIPMAMITTIGLWITQTAMITKKISWNDVFTMREVLYSMEANRMSETLKEQLIKNAVGMEVLHLLIHVVPFVACIVGIICDHYYTIHCMATFSMIPWVFDDFDVVNRWSKLLNPSQEKDYHLNFIYVLSHFFHTFCAVITIIFSYVVDIRNKKIATAWIIFTSVYHLLL